MEDYTKNIKKMENPKSQEEMGFGTLNKMHKRNYELIRKMDNINDRILDLDVYVPYKRRKLSETESESMSE